MTLKAEKPKADKVVVPEVENILPGTRLHLGDGRVLEFGEKATVSNDIAELLRDRKQAK